MFQKKSSRSVALVALSLLMVAGLTYAAGQAAAQDKPISEQTLKKVFEAALPENAYVAPATPQK